MSRQKIHTNATIVSKKSNRGFEILIRKRGRPRFDSTNTARPSVGRSGYKSFNPKRLLLLLFGIGHQNTTAVFANDDLLALTDLHLALRRDPVEASAARIASYRHHCESVAYVATDSLIVLQQPFGDLGLRFGRLVRKFRHLRSRLGLDTLQLGLFGFEILPAFRHQGLGLIDLRLYDLDSGSKLIKTLFGQIDFKLLILDLLGNGIELAVIPDVVLLLLVIADEYLGLIHLALALLGEGVELLDFGIDILDTRPPPGPPCL